MQTLCPWILSDRLCVHLSDWLWIHFCLSVFNFLNGFPPLDSVSLLFKAAELFIYISYTWHVSGGRISCQFDIWAIHNTLMNYFYRFCKFYKIYKIYKVYKIYKIYKLSEFYKFYKFLIPGEGFWKKNCNTFPCSSFWHGYLSSYMVRRYVIFARTIQYLMWSKLGICLQLDQYNWVQFIVNLFRIVHWTQI